MLGIVDRLAGKSNHYSSNQDYAIYYYCFNGYVYPYNLGINGVKVNSGEIVEVVVDLSNGKVEFKVSDIVFATVNGYQILAENNRQFVPSIEMYNTNDCVEWIES
jgi:hypothetical protein